MRYPKLNLLRSKAYRMYVSTKPCFACGVEGFSNACHPNQAKYGKGGAMKAGDEFCFPLCVPHWGMPGCHYLHDLAVEMTKAERDELEDRYVERMQSIARAEGRREFKAEEAA